MGNQRFRYIFEKISQNIEDEFVVDDVPQRQLTLTNAVELRDSTPDANEKEKLNTLIERLKNILLNLYKSVSLEIPKKWIEDSFSDETSIVNTVSSDETLRNKFIPKDWETLWDIIKNNSLSNNPIASLAKSEITKIIENIVDINFYEIDRNQTQANNQAKKIYEYIKSNADEHIRTGAWNPSNVKQLYDLYNSLINTSNHIQRKENMKWFVNRAYFLLSIDIDGHLITPPKIWWIGDKAQDIYKQYFNKNQSSCITFMLKNIESNPDYLNKIKIEHSKRFVAEIKSRRDMISAGLGDVNGVSIFKLFEQGTNEPNETIFWNISFEKLYKTILVLKNKKDIFLIDENIMGHTVSGLYEVINQIINDLPYYYDEIENIDSAAGIETNKVQLINKIIAYRIDKNKTQGLSELKTIYTDQQLQKMIQLGIINRAFPEMAYSVNNDSFPGSSTVAAFSGSFNKFRIDIAPTKNTIDKLQKNVELSIENTINKTKEEAEKYKNKEDPENKKAIKELKIKDYQQRLENLKPAEDVIKGTHLHQTSKPVDNISPLGWVAGTYDYQNKIMYVTEIQSDVMQRSGQYRDPTKVEDDRKYMLLDLEERKEDKLNQKEELLQKLNKPKKQKNPKDILAEKVKRMNQEIQQLQSQIDILQNENKNIELQPDFEQNQKYKENIQQINAKNNIIQKTKIQTENLNKQINNIVLKSIQEPESSEETDQTDHVHENQTIAKLDDEISTIEKEIQILKKPWVPPKGVLDFHKPYRFHDYKTQIENTFRGWIKIFYNTLIREAKRNKMKEVRIATAKTVAKMWGKSFDSDAMELYEKIYNEAANELYKSTTDLPRIQDRYGEWNVIDIKRQDIKFANSWAKNFLKHGL